MRSLALSLASAVPVVFAGASAVCAANTACVGTLSGNIVGNVVVPNGASCTLSDTTVAGNVHVSQNASLTIDATQQPTTIDGNVQASPARPRSSGAE
jgi:hypothetical protein